MIEELMKLGLEEKEAVIYIALLKKRNQSATEISKKTKINRSVVYSVLDKLIEKGLVNKILIKNKTAFSATNPKALRGFLEDKSLILNNLLPKLNSLKEDTSNQVTVEFFQGLKGGLTVLKDILEEGKDYVSFGDDGSWIDVSETLVEQYLRQLIEKKIKERVLLKDGTKLTSNLKNSEIRYLPKNLDMKTITTIYGNKVAIAIFEKPYYIILINSKTLAQTYKSFFEELWKIAKK